MTSSATFRTHSASPVADYSAVTRRRLVGFLFLNTSVFGVGIPFHRDFEEVNLRFYVRRKVNDGWRRAGVCSRGQQGHAADAQE